ncbi:hypothetical protein [Companilactobacillus halodurans]|uniref:WxL domain-containing protein n=1 Tax=Companilactobacillus halodurans TaxID=2584183 RepID=A0A5P0ZXA6_9LACO|nr:hypothetical protein [Companilactobacillus halodurans]MQS75258.1 hypothetical protein [Companilactobacillus halodurans]MQS97607.1 hypothetical protein [Companilactobacillus halodurans]
MVQRHHLLFKLAFFWIFICLLMPFLHPRTILADYSAATTLTDTDKEAIKNAPEGLLISKYFTKQDKTDTDINDKTYPYRHNFATTDESGKVLILASGSRQTDTEDVKEDVILGFQKTLGTIQNTSSYGAIWSDETASNYIDISKEQQITAWLYFGKSSNDEETNGQGTALVLQNDPLKTKAIGAGQEGLGVYGYDDSTYETILFKKSPKLLEPADVAKTAVQNSVAIEFDTQQNKLSLHQPTELYTPKSDNPHTTLSGFDTVDTRVTPPSGYPLGAQSGGNGGFGHIAVTYPGMPGTYAQSEALGTTAMTETWEPFTAGYTQMHVNPASTTLINDEDLDGNTLYWHHITMTWHPSTDGGKTATIDYSFNDKNIDNVVNTNYNGVINQNFFVRIDGSTQVDLSTFGDIQDNKLLWGFTGANSSASDVESKLVSLESIPALVNAEANSYIYDTTIDKKITDDKSDPVYNDDKTVEAGDDLALHYNLNYINGHQDWDGVTGSITLPDNMKYTPDANNNIGTITYANGVTENIPVSELKSTSVKDVSGKTVTENIVTHKFTQALNDSNQTAEVIINGQAVNDTEENIDVDAKPAKFSSEANISTTSTPEFTIKYKKDWNLTLSTPKTDYDLIYKKDNQDLNFDTTLTYDKDHKFEKSDPIKYTITIDAAKYTKDITVDSQDSSASYMLDLKDILGDDFWSIFDKDKDQPINVTVQATDQDHIKSNPLTFLVTVKPDKTLELKASESLNFQDINLFNNQKVLMRKNDFDLNVISYNSVWKLFGQAGDLINDSNEKFDGNVIYRNDTKTQNVSQEKALIAHQDSASLTKDVDEISDDWQKDTGILLEQDGLNSVGSYHGDLTWTLTDTI